MFNFCNDENFQERGHPWTDHQWGLCIFDDVIEFCGPSSVKYQEHFVQAMLHYVTDSQAEVRQAAAYGCGIMAQYGGAAYAPYCPSALVELVKVINDPSSREVDNISPTENAISAFTKILKWNPGGTINVDDFLPTWFNMLPVYEDADEAPYVYGYLCDLVERNHPLILGQNNANLPKIIQVN